MKLHWLIKENIDVNRVDLKLLNYLHKNSIPKNSTDVYNTLGLELHIEDNDLIGNVIKLYKNNIIEDDEIYDESIDWVIPSENDYSNKRNALAKSLDIDPELFVYIKDIYDLEVYQNIIDKKLYEVGTYDDLVRSLREKMIETDFNIRKEFLNKYITLNQELLDYSIMLIVESEVDDMGQYEMISYIGGSTTEDIEDIIETLEELEVELKTSSRNKNLLLKKIDKLESEKAVIEQQIVDEEDSIEYSKYLDNIEIKISEISEEYNKLLFYISSIEDEIESLKEKNPSKDDIIKMYTHYRYEELYEEYMDNPYYYISESGFLVREAIDNGIIEFDFLGMIKEIISEGIKSENIKIVDVNNQSYFIVNYVYMQSL